MKSVLSALPINATYKGSIPMIGRDLPVPNELAARYAKACKPIAGNPKASAATL